MQPEKFVNDLKSSERRKLIIERFFTASLFLTSFLVLGPVIHEISHILALEMISCPHYIDFGFKFLSGLHAEITPLCSPANSFLIFFYSIGYLSTLLIAGLSSIVALETDFASKLFAATGSGLFMSILLSIGVEGDVQNAAHIIGISTGESFILVLFIILGIFISSLKTLQLFLELERKE